MVRKAGNSLAGVTFDGVAKIYPDGTRAVNAFDLDVKDGEFMVLVGPSGCGKTTALRMLAIPLAVFLAFQRYFAEGLLAGSVK